MGSAEATNHDRSTEKANGSLEETTAVEVSSPPRTTLLGTIFSPVFNFFSPAKNGACACVCVVYVSMADSDSGCALALLFQPLLAPTLQTRRWRPRRSSSSWTWSRLWRRPPARRYPRSRCAAPRPSTPVCRSLRPFGRHATRRCRPWPRRRSLTLTCRPSQVPREKLFYLYVLISHPGVCASGKAAY